MIALLLYFTQSILVLHYLFDIIAKVKKCKEIFYNTWQILTQFLIFNFAILTFGLENEMNPANAIKKRLRKKERNSMKLCFYKSHMSHILKYIYYILYILLLHNRIY